MTEEPRQIPEVEEEQPGADGAPLDEDYDFDPQPEEDDDDSDDDVEGEGVEEEEGPA